MLITGFFFRGGRTRTLDEMIRNVYVIFDSERDCSCCVHIFNGKKSKYIPLTIILLDPSMLHEVEVLLNSSGSTAEQEIGVALKGLVQFKIRLMEHNNHKTQSISVRISKIISQASNKYFSFIYSTCESIHLIISNCYTDIKLLT